MSILDNAPSPEAKAAGNLHTEETIQKSPHMLKDYEERLIAEYCQLSGRIEKLDTMLAKYAEGELEFTPECSYGCLFGQLCAMVMYRESIEARPDFKRLMEGAYVSTTEPVHA